MTDRLYLGAPDLLEFSATVLAVRALGERPAVILDRTAFYPEGGGQPADHGVLDGLPVLDVQEVDGELLHALGGPAPRGVVRGQVDAARRRDHLQQHHGQHLLSAVLEASLGARTLSFHLGAERSSVDLDLPAARLDAATLRAVEGRVNELGLADLPVEAREFSKEELAALPLRKEALKGSRVVVIGDASGGIVDASPCGGTHPRRTGRVGAVAVLSAQRWGQGARVEFACGGRILRLLASAADQLAQAAEALRCAPAEVAEAARRTAADLLARRKEADRLALALAEREAERLAAPGGPLVRAVLASPGVGAVGWLRGVASGLSARGKVALLGAVEDGRAYLCFARPKGSGLGMGDLVKAAAGLLGGKGGGTPDLAQGGGPEAGRLEEALDLAAGRMGGTE